MPLDPHAFAAHLARAVDLFRDPDRKEDQKREFRVMVGLLKEGDVVVRADAGTLSVNGTVVAGPDLGQLVQRLELHAVHEMTIPKDTPVAQVFELLRAIADQPGTASDVDTRLRTLGVSLVSVTMTRLADLLPEPRPADAVLPPSPPLPEAAIAEVLPAPPSLSKDPVDVLADLAANPAVPNVSETLSLLGRQVEGALKAGRIEQVLRIIVGITRIEQRVASENIRRTYGVTLKRMFTKGVLEALAQLSGVPVHHDDAIVALQRSGADGMEVLLDALVEGETLADRRVVFNALAQMKQGVSQLVHMLGHHQWYVVRNVAELVGELGGGADEAITALGKQLGHEDERVRQAVALALAKIGSVKASEPLRRALRDQSREVRLQAALGVGGRKSSALAMPLMVALEEEQDPEVQREFILALGRIGSPDAVQALIKLAQPSASFFGRKPTPLRLAAVEGLRLAATPAAVGTLQGLGGDSDRQVKAAAQGALAEIKKKV